MHLRVLRRLGAQIVAVADPEEEARGRGIALAPGAAACATVEELLRQPGLEAVVVTSPTALHAEHAEQVLAAGLHLYLEKPLATNVADGRRVVAAAQAAGVVAAIGFNRRRHPLLVRARQLVAGGALGPVRLAQGCFAEPTSGAGWRLDVGGGGPLLDLASHHVDALRWLLADEAAWVEGTSTGDGATATLHIGFRGGTLAQLAASFAAGRADSLVLHGADGSLALDRYRRSLTLTRPAARYAARPARQRPNATLLRWQARASLQQGYDPSFAGALAAWLAALRGEASEVPTLEDGLRSLEVVAAGACGAGRVAL